MTSLLRHVAAMWSAPGVRYDELSRGLRDAGDHMLVRLGAGHGAAARHETPRHAPHTPRHTVDRALDVACGTGLVARELAARSPGARVVGVDIALGLLSAARSLTHAAGLDVAYTAGDAEQLPFPDASFDAVVSNFGVPFAARPARVAAELARVCAPRGRLGLTAWVDDEPARRLNAIVVSHVTGSPPPDSQPAPWGTRDRVAGLLGDAFQLGFEDGVSYLRAASPDDAWTAMTEQYGPMHAVARTLPAARRDALRRDVVAFYGEFCGELGVALPRHYLLAVGTRRP